MTTGQILWVSAGVFTLFTLAFIALGVNLQVSTGIGMIAWGIYIAVKQREYAGKYNENGDENAR